MRLTRINGFFRWALTQSRAECDGCPPNRNEAPIGHYMLFITDGNDVPSVAKIIQGLQVSLTAATAAATRRRHRRRRRRRRHRRPLHRSAAPPGLLTTAA